MTYSLVANAKTYKTASENRCLAGSGSVPGTIESANGTLPLLIPCIFRNLWVEQSRKKKTAALIRYTMLYLATLISTSQQLAFFKKSESNSGEPRCRLRVLHAHASENTRARDVYGASRRSTTRSLVVGRPRATKSSEGLRTRRSVVAARGQEEI